MSDQINCSVGFTPNPDSVSAIAEVFAYYMHRYEFDTCEPQEQTLMKQARQLIEHHYGYEFGQSLPQVGVEMFIEEFVGQLKGQSHTLNPATLKRFGNTMFDWGLARGLLRRPETATLQ